MRQPARRRRRGLGADFPVGVRTLVGADEFRRRASGAGFALRAPNADSRGGRLTGEASAVPSARRRCRRSGVCASPVRGRRFVVVARRRRRESGSFRAVFAEAGPRARRPAASGSRGSRALRSLDGRVDTAARRSFGFVAARSARVTGLSSGGRQRISTLPRCWTGAASSSSAIRASIVSRCARSSENTRTLMSPCARSATSISCITCGVRPGCPTLTTGRRACACARSSRRRWGTNAIIREV